MKFIPTRVEMRSKKYSLIFSEFSSFLSHVTDCMKTMSAPIFRIFFMTRVVPVDTYIPPKRGPVWEGRKPTIVITPKRIIEKRLILLFLAGFQNISAINTVRAAAISNSS